MSLASHPSVAPLLAVIGRAVNPMALVDGEGNLVGSNAAFRLRFGDDPSALTALLAALPRSLAVHPVPGLPGHRLLDEPEAPGAAALGTVTWALGMPLWQWDPATREGVWAPQHHEVFGIAEGEPFTPTWAARVHRDDLETAQAAIETCLREGTVEVEYRYHHPVRGLRWMHTRGAMVERPPGPIMIGITMDVTGRRAADARIRDSELHLRRVLDTLSTFVGVTTTDGILLEANRAPIEVAGASAEDVLGRPFEETYWWAYDPAIQARIRDALRRAAGGETVRFDVPVRVAGDRRLVVDFQVAPVLDADGRVTHLVPSGVDVTERVRIEAALRHSEQRLQRALEAAGAGVFETDLATSRSTVTPGTNRLFGFADDASVSVEGYVARVHPEDRPSFTGAIEESAATGRGHEIEYRVRLPSGETRWIASRANMTTDESGRPILVGTLMDVTERQATEATLRESEQRFRATFELAAIGLAHVSLDGAWLRVNDRICEILGYAREALLDRTFQDITHPDDLAADLAQTARLVAGEISTYTMEKRYIRSDGSVVWAELTGSVVRRPDGSPEYFVAAVQDISERKRADETIRQQLAEIEAIYQLAGVGLAVLDRDLRFVRVNERLAAMSGAEASEHIGRTVREIVPGLADQVEGPFREILETGIGRVGVELTGTTAAEPGVDHTWLENWIPIFDPGGQVVGISVTAEDITERRKVDQMRDTFIGMLSHELRTPMTSLYAASQLLLKRRRHDAGDTELIAEVAAGAERLHRIVENLLVLARVERGLTLPAAEPVLLQRVLPGVLRGERRLWPSQRVELAPLPPNLPPVRSDADALAQVVRNLISNAAKYGRPGGRVEICVEPLGDGVCIRVLDDGPGIGEGDPARLFDIYYRAEDAALRAPGAGVGLFVCRSLVEGMGGTISATNRPGGGAEFRVCLVPFDDEA
jgi:PAS domain S-box-containing protein